MIDVVAAIIKNSDNKILIAQRNLKKSQGGLWEFPGGKIEPNETKEAAIRAGAGICYERYGGSFKFFFNALYNYTRYEDIIIEPIIVY